MFSSCIFDNVWFITDNDFGEGWWSVLACSLVVVESDSWCAHPTALWMGEGLAWGWLGGCLLFSAGLRGQFASCEYPLNIDFLLTQCRSNWPNVELAVQFSISGTGVTRSNAWALICFSTPECWQINNLNSWVWRLFKHSFNVLWSIATTSWEKWHPKEFFLRMTRGFTSWKHWREVHAEMLCQSLVAENCKFQG